MIERIESTGDERVAIVVGDRMCTGCGYNLTGQPILREQHYQMLIVRCPECAAVAAVQEYPTLGRWARRWGALLAALWFVFVLAAWAGGAGAIFGVAFGAANASAQSYWSALHERWMDWSQQQPQTTNPTPGPGRTITTTRSGTGRVIIIGSTASFQAWWQAQDQAALLAAAGGYFGVFEWRALWVWIPLALAAFTVGWFFASILLGRPKRGLMVIGGAIIVVALIYAALYVAGLRARVATGVYDASMQQIGAPMLFASIGFAALPLALGLVWGRPITRRLICWTLPARLRGALSVLWEADGLEPPGPRSGIGKRLVGGGLTSRSRVGP